MNHSILLISLLAHDNFEGKISLLIIMLVYNPERNINEGILQYILNVRFIRLCCFTLVCAANAHGVVVSGVGRLDK